MIFGTAIQRRGQDPGDGGLADATMPAKDVPVSGPALLDGILESAGHVLLPDHLGELLWAVFSSEDGITHGERRVDYT